MANDLTEEQIDFINEPSSNIYLKACPGAGKTKVIVYRFIKRAIELSQCYNRRSIAALSFTNVAVNEISSRCHKEKVSHLVEFPNYVGTFDGFIIRYIFRQLICSPVKRPLTILESWNSINAQVLGGKYGAIPLSKFDFSGNKVKYGSRGGYKNNINYAKNPAKWLELAVETRNKYLSSCIVSTSEVRNCICRSSSNKTNIIYSNLSKRFSEIIVDEIQDCNWQDLIILKNLREHGANIVMVGDLNQSIYGFRDVNLEEISNYVNTHKPLCLTNNFRSTQNICNYSASLKADKNIDTAKSEHKDENIPIIIIPYKGKINKKISELFFKIVVDKNLSLNKSKVIAYKEKSSLLALGIKKVEPGTTAFETLGCAINVYKDISSPQKEKHHALINVEKLLLRLLDQDINHLSSEIYCERFNIEYRWLKRCALFVLDSFPKAPNNKSGLDPWIMDVKKKLSELPLPLNSKLTWIAPGKLFKKQKNWSIRDTGVDISFSSTIHGVKGEEFDSLLLVMDDKKSDSIFKNWMEGIITEPERVIYVAVTRAKKLLCIAIPDSFLDVMRGIVEKEGIIYEIIN